VLAGSGAKNRAPRHGVKQPLAWTIDTCAWLLCLTARSAASQSPAKLNLLLSRAQYGHLVTAPGGRLVAATLVAALAGVASLCVPV